MCPLLLWRVLSRKPFGPLCNLFSFIDPHPSIFFFLIHLYVLLTMVVSVGKLHFCGPSSDRSFLLAITSTPTLIDIPPPLPPPPDNGFTGYL